MPSSGCRSRYQALAQDGFQKRLYSLDLTMRASSSDQGAPGLASTEARARGSTHSHNIGTQVYCQPRPGRISLIDRGTGSNKCCIKPPLNFVCSFDLHISESG